jgi:hypothetical protein
MAGKRYTVVDTKLTASMNKLRAADLLIPGNQHGPVAPRKLCQGGEPPETQGSPTAQSQVSSDRSPGHPQQARRPAHGEPCLRAGSGIVPTKQQQQQKTTPRPSRRPRSNAVPSLAACSMHPLHPHDLRQHLVRMTSCFARFIRRDLVYTPLARLVRELELLGEAFLPTPLPNSPEPDEAVLGCYAKLPVLFVTCSQ